jgi:hypothetical protein
MDVAAHNSIIILILWMVADVVAVKRWLADCERFVNRAVVIGRGYYPLHCGKGLTEKQFCKI